MVTSPEETLPRGILNIDLTAAVALNPKNFTSLNRTPWAGTLLASGIKQSQAQNKAQKIGESWEVSCDPEAPSRLVEAPEATLADLIACRTSECLSGALVASGRATCDILIKLLNADSPLSLQIHPSDDNKHLKSNECGKPESWLVLSAKEGSGLYLGFKNALPVEVIRKQLETNTFNADDLQFVPVKPGDFFEIQPHVPHAIGPGVVLLEPQRIIAGKSGKTYRLWDWNRKYNSAGVLDQQNGRPRDLHISESMPLLDPANQTGESYIAKLKRSAAVLTPSPGVTLQIYPANKWYQVIDVKLAPNARLQIKAEAGFACATVISGHVASASQYGRRISMRQGESYFIPASALPNTLKTVGDEAHLTIVVPSGPGIPNHEGRVFQ